MTTPRLMRMASDDLEVEVVPELGGRIHRIRTASGLDLLRTPADVMEHSRLPFHWGSYPLVPWANRYWGGRIEFEGRTIEVPVNWTDGTAMHGEGYVRPWEVHGDGSLSFRGGGHGFPWSYLATQNFVVNGPTVVFTLSVTNVDNSAMPAGLGFHPWFTAGRITLDAASWSPTIEDARDGRVEPVSGSADLRAGQARTWGWDSVWSDIGRRTVTLDWPDEAVTATLGFTPGADFVTVAAIEEVGAMAVEPQTMQVNAPATLQAGETLALTYSLTVSTEGTAAT